MGPAPCSKPRIEAASTGTRDGLDVSCTCQIEGLDASCARYILLYVNYCRAPATSSLSAYFSKTGPRHSALKNCIFLSISRKPRPKEVDIFSGVNYGLTKLCLYYLGECNDSYDKRVERYDERSVDHIVSGKESLMNISEYCRRGYCCSVHPLCVLFLAMKVELQGSSLRKQYIQIQAKIIRHICSKIKYFWFTLYLDITSRVNLLYR